MRRRRISPISLQSAPPVLDPVLPRECPAHLGEPDTKDERAFSAGSECRPGRYAPASVANTVSNPRDRTRLTLIAAALVLACSGEGRTQRAIDDASRLADHCETGAALSVLDQATASGAPSTRSLALARARLLIQLDRSAEALAVLDAVASERIDAPADVVFAKALALADLGRTAAYEAALARALELGFDRGLVESARALGRIRDGRVDDARRILETLVHERNPPSSAFMNLAAIRSATGRLDEAELLVRAGWTAGVRDPNGLRAEPMNENLVKSGRIDDLLASTERDCSGW